MTCIQFVELAQLKIFRGSTVLQTVGTHEKGSVLVGQNPAVLLAKLDCDLWTE